MTRQEAIEMLESNVTLSKATLEEIRGVLRTQKENQHTDADDWNYSDSCWEESDWENSQNC